MSLADLVTVLLAGSVVAGFLITRAMLRAARRAAIRMEHHAERRLIDAAFIWLGLGFLRGRHRRHVRRVARPPALEGDEIYRACSISRWQGDPAACRWCNGMLPLDRPRFCGPECADGALDNHDFDRARSVRRRMDRYRCRQCGSRDHLEVHHAGERAMGRHGIPGCWHHLAGLVTLCRRCHSIETAGQHAADALPRPRRWVS